MRHRQPALAALALAVAVSAGFGPRQAPARPPAATTVTPDEQRARDLDAIFGTPALARAIVAIRIESLTSGAVLYARNDERLVIPASNLKIFTLAAAAHRLGWDFRYETRLELAGDVENGTLRGDLVAWSSGDPSIGSLDVGHAPLFLAWAEALERAGVRRIDGRIVGDDSAFDDEPYGAGWAWDYLSAGYAAPSGALSYNENVAVLRVTPAAAVNTPARIIVTPPGHAFEIMNQVSTGPAGSPANLTVERRIGSRVVTLRGRMPLSGGAVIRTVAVEDPTRYFVDALAAALASRGITATGGAWDIDDLSAPPVTRRRVIATRESEPLSSLIGYAMKSSQNFYGEMLLKTVGAAGAAGSIERGRQSVRAVLTEWGVPSDATVIIDGSGLSRYNYATAHAIVATLKAVWHDDRLRGPFVASLPVGGHDGTLQSRMRDSELDRRIQAKTGTMNNVRALSGYAETSSGEKLAFSMIANHFTAPSAEIDAVMERALERLIRNGSMGSTGSTGSGTEPAIALWNP